MTQPVDVCRAGRYAIDVLYEDNHLLVVVVLSRLGGKLLLLLIHGALQLRQLRRLRNARHGEQKHEGQKGRSNDATNLKALVA